MKKYESTADELIRRLALKPHPEGGFYREIYRSQQTVLAERGRRAGLTTIYFLLRRGEKSALHSVLSDEVWHFYAGDSLRLWRLAPEFTEHEFFILGPPGKMKADAFNAPVAVIPAGHWQAAECLGEYSLVGCTVGPGFDFADFKMLRDDAQAGKMLSNLLPELIPLL